MFPIVLKQDTAIARVGCSSNCTILCRIPQFINNGIACFPQSEIYEKAQQISPIISSSLFSIRTLAREGMHLSIYLKSAAGRPLQKFDKVQLAFLINVEEPVLTESSRFAIGSTAPEEITISLILGPSPAIFPMPQIAYSITSMCGEPSNFINWSMAPF